MEVDSNQYDTSDLIKFAYEDQPAKMQDVFNELMMGKIQDSIQQKKVEVAQQFFASDSDEDGEEYYDDQEEHNNTDEEEV